MAANPEGNQLEQDIARIEQELATKREALAHEKGDREILHEVVRERIHNVAPTPVPVTPTPAADPNAATVPAEIHQKVQALVNVAFLKSVDEAIKEARATNNAAIIDAFHDLLVDELFTHLVERGKLHKM